MSDILGSISLSSRPGVPQHAVDQATLTTRLATGTGSARDIVQAFLDGGGLRVRALSSVNVVPGTPIIIS